MRINFFLRTIFGKIFPTLFLLVLGGCAGMSEPPAPLWDPNLYETIAVLPVRMSMVTGREFFQSEDTDLSDRMGGLMQESLSAAMRLKGYEVLAPEDLSERLMEEDDLADAFFSLADAYGFMGDQTYVTPLEAMEGAALIGEELGADLIVLAHGNGEYHSFEENLFQGMITGFLSGGKEAYDTPSSFLRLEVFFVDGVEGTRVARILPRSIPFEKSLIPLTRRVRGLLRRVPEKDPSGPGDGTP